MVSILKKIMRRFDAKSQRLASERVFVAAFGKHPGWDDHIDDINLETDILIAVKRILYARGIGNNISSGSWDKLQEDQRIKEFRHLLVWRIGSNTVVGRIWSSQDGKGRTSYPMVVCVQCCQLPIEWSVRNILPRLQRIEEVCVSTTSAANVRVTLESARVEFRRLARESQLSQDSAIACPGALMKLAECFEMDMDRKGLLRILYHLERELVQCRSDDSSISVFSRPVLLRIPVSSHSMPETMLLWIDFLSNRFGNSTPVLVLMPVAENWIDVIIGEPAESQLYCLRASVKTIPLTSSIPYSMDSEFLDRTNQLIADSRGERTEHNPTKKRE